MAGIPAPPWFICSACGIKVAASPPDPHRCSGAFGLRLVTEERYNAFLAVAEAVGWLTADHDALCRRHDPSGTECTCGLSAVNRAFAAWRSHSATIAPESKPGGKATPR